MLGDGELAPDRTAQMRQVETAEHAVPVGVVALRPPNGPPRLGRIAAAAREGRKREHRLMHPVCLGVLDEEMVPVSPPHERCRGGETLWPQLLFELGEVLLGGRRKRQLLNLPI